MAYFASGTADTKFQRNEVVTGFFIGHFTILLLDITVTSLLLYGIVTVRIGASVQARTTRSVGGVAKLPHSPLRNAKQSLIAIPTPLPTTDWKDCVLRTNSTILAHNVECGNFAVMITCVWLLKYEYFVGKEKLLLTVVNNEDLMHHYWYVGVHVSDRSDSGPSERRRRSARRKWRIEEIPPFYVHPVGDDVIFFRYVARWFNRKHFQVRSIPALGIYFWFVVLSLYNQLKYEE